MSLKNAASQLAAHGRNGDSTLVHMTPSEVHALQGLAAANGGHITINPDTGLPEANILKSLLPMLAGLALGPAGLGIASSALGAGAMVGGATALATGDLKKGLMAGLGAYGGAGLGGNLIGAGAGAAQNAAVNSAQAGLASAAPVASPVLAQGAALPSIAPAATTAAQAAAPAATTAAQTMAPIAQLPVTPAVQAANMVPTTAGMPEIAGLNEQGILNTAAADATKAFQNLPMHEQLMQGGKAIWNDPSSFLTKENLKYGLAAAAPTLAGMMTGKTLPFEADTEQYKYTYNPGRVTDPEALYAGAETGERTYFQPEYTRVMAEGGLAGGVSAMAKGGTAEKGRFLEGPGDGVSDSIPATINGDQPARLADGEFVIPARIVSELGNGSSKAGARKLYAMMDRIQNTRSKTTGKGRVAVNSRAERHLPA
jgi:hypothetical protein